jgi:hypothetical protein
LLFTKLARKTDPETSHEAALKVRNRPSEDAVYRELKKRKTGLADFELEARLAGKFFPQRVRTARSELVKQGRVRFAESYRMTRSGRRSRVWVIA